MRRVLVGRRSGKLRDWGGRGRFDVRHGHGGGGQRLLPRRLSLLQRGRGRQGGLRHLDLESGVRVRRRLGLEGNLRLRRLSGERKRLGRHGMRQEGLGLQAVRGGLRLTVERRLRVGLRGGRRRLALRHAQRLQGRVG